MAAFAKLLVLIAIFLLASNANAFQRLSPVAGNQVQEKYLIQFEAVNGINTSYMFEAINGVNAKQFEAVNGINTSYTFEAVDGVNAKQFEASMASTPLIHLRQSMVSMRMHHNLQLLRFLRETRFLREHEILHPC